MKSRYLLALLLVQFAFTGTIAHAATSETAAPSRVDLKNSWYYMGGSYSDSW